MNTKMGFSLENSTEKIHKYYIKVKVASSIT